jgi:rfaE bifunctional protein nucleotidyltransferase chain/domain
LLQKIIKLNKISSIINEQKKNGRKIVQCHGVFDLLHPGHIRHFQEAKKQGDILIVSITPDKFVNKGPGRPIFNERLRLESLASLELIDYVVLNTTPDARSCIEEIKPHIYVKGREYEKHDKDVTGKISEEVAFVKKYHGDIHYTDDIIFSSSRLINRFFDPLPIELQKTIRLIKEKYSSSELVNIVESFSNLKVLIIGDAIIDEYQYVEPLGQSGKGSHMVAKNINKEIFLGGALIIANHVAEFTDKVTLVTSLGYNCKNSAFINKTLNKKVKGEFFLSKKENTLIKKRYVLKDGNSILKLFETYSSNEALLTDNETDKIVDFLNKKANQFDIVIACDFGNGFTNMNLVNTISNLETFVAINTQSNGGNRGFNVITHYKRADYISLNEPEARLAMQDRKQEIVQISKDLKEKLKANSISITRGVNGVLCVNNKYNYEIPAMNTNSIDRLGAGDSYLAMSSLALASKNELLIAAFLGSIAAALDVQIIGNKEPIRKMALLKFLIRLMK